MFTLPSNVILLTFLYFIQGLPYGVQTQFLPVYLRSYGVDLTSVSLLKLLHVPWLCKAVWAPLVDRYQSKKTWLLWSIAALLVTCILTSLVQPQCLTLLCICLFLLNFFAATQDIAVDSIAISLLTSDELGLGNTAQVVGYKLGSAFGGGILVMFISVLGWTGLFLVLAVLYLEAFMFVFVTPSLRKFNQRHQHATKCSEQVQTGRGSAYASDVISKHAQFNVDANSSSKQASEDKGSLENSSAIKGSSIGFTNVKPDRHFEELPDLLRETKKVEDSDGKQDVEPHHIPLQQCGRRFPQSGNSADADHGTNSKEKKHLPLFAEVFSVSGTKWMMGFVLLYKLGEQGALSMLPLLLVDRKVPETEVGFWIGVIGQVISIVGSLLGGWLISSKRMPVCLLVQQMCLLRLMPLGAQALIVVYWHANKDSGNLAYYYVAIAAMLVLLLLSGAITTASFTLMMQCSRLATPGVQATHYSSLATMEVLGKLMFMSISGWLVDTFGYPFTFLIFIVLSVLVVPLFSRCPVELTRSMEGTAPREQASNWGSACDEQVKENKVKMA